jgi:hypothetical protein
MTRVVFLHCCLLGLLLGCTAEAEVTLTRQQLMDPDTCKGCHPNHYREWSSSMHAYASVDPIFIAMNKRGQREANLGPFCVKCHAPMAVRENLTVDGLNLQQLPNQVKGVTCYFCHNAIGVGGEAHNNPLELADDTTMRASIRDPVKQSAHGAVYSKFHDRTLAESATMCGSCHDIQTPQGVHLERTFAEYKDSLFARSDLTLATGFDTCQGCHMNGYRGVAATVRGVMVKEREVHEHLWPAVDQALTDFPEASIMKLAVEQCALPNGIRPFFVEADPNGVGAFNITLETLAGHAMPSGAAHDRRMWLEVVSYDDAGNVLQSTGMLADGTVENFEPPNDAWTFHDHIFGEQGQAVHMFWDAAPSAAHPMGYENYALPYAKTAVVGAHSVTRSFNLGISGGRLAPARATIRLRMRPMGLDVLQDLVQSGDLDPSFLASIPTLTVRSMQLQWAMDGDPRNFTATDDTDKDCRRYRCILDGGTPQSCGLTQSP